MAILTPALCRSGGVDRVQLAVEEVGPPALNTGAAARQIRHVSGQCRVTLEAPTYMARHQRFHDDPLPDVQSEGPS